MKKRIWSRVRPTSLRHAIELCLEYGRDKHNRSVDRVADLMGLQSKWTLYKWMQSGRLPANLIRPFEHATDATFVTQYIASSAHRLLIKIPNGQPADGQDIHQLQTAVTEAIGQLLNYHRGECSAEETLGAIDRAMGGLAWQRANVDAGSQPALDFEEESEADQ